MREILFRGKRKDNNEWVYGDLIQSVNDGGKYILPKSESDLTALISVLPKTVGQFTGMIDKLGEKIFEGDIVSDQNKSQAIVEWSEDHLQFIAVFGSETQELGGWAERVPYFTHYPNSIK